MYFFVFEVGYRFCGVLCELISFCSSLFSRAGWNRCCQSPHKHWVQRLFTIFVKFCLWNGRCGRKRFGEHRSKIDISKLIISVVLLVVVWNCVSRFVPALRQFRNWVRAVPCGATVLGFRVRSLVGSKSLSSHKRLEFHRWVLRVPQKPSRERVLLLQNAVECAGAFMLECPVESNRSWKEWKILRIKEYRWSNATNYSFELRNVLYFRCFYLFWTLFVAFGITQIQYCIFNP